MTRVPGDIAARERALDPRRSFIVQAPAGSGKTELLTRRYLTLLGGVDAPEEILAITFTRKAAAEMRERVLKALEAPPGGEGGSGTASTEAARIARARAETLGWSLRENPSRLRILTIDGLNSHLVGRMPYLSGHSPSAAVTADTGPLYRRAARLVLEHLEAEEDPYAEALAAVLIHLDNRASRLVGYVETFLGRRDQWLRRRPSGVGSGLLRKGMEAALAELVGHRLKAIHAHLAPHLPEMIRLAAYAASNLPEQPGLPAEALGNPPGPEPAHAGVWRFLSTLFLTKEGELRKSADKRTGFPSGPDGGMKAAMVGLLETLRASEGAAQALKAARLVPDPVYAEEEWALVVPVLALYDLAVACLRVAMGEESATDFTEVALRALQALGGDGAPTDLALALDHRISHLLVDEFQDTSRTQYELLQKLTEGWTPGDGRTLFLVGDPMQSIYRFREADVALFGRAREEGVGGVRAEPLLLTANFRSKPGLVEHFNRTFPLIFPSVDDRSSGAVSYSGAEAALEGGEPAREAFHALLGDDREAEARIVADEIADALAADGEATVAVLVRARNHAAAIVAELNRRAVPFRGENLDPLGESLAVIDLINLARALSDRADRQAWLGALRAPWCALTLAECRALVAKSADPLPALIKEAVGESRIPGAGCENLARFWNAVAPVLENVGRRPFGRVVESAWTRLGAPAFLDARGLADASRALALIDSHCPGDLPDLAGLDEKIAKLYSAPDPEGGRVSIMTIHNAKGLQFSTVIVPGLGRRPKSSGQELITWEEAPGGGLVVGVAPPVKAGAQKGVAGFLAILESEREANERRRLLYVALTRARENLILVGHASYVEKGESYRPERGSLLETLWPAVRERFSGPPPERAQTVAAKCSMPPLQALDPAWTLPPIVDPELKARPRELKEAAAAEQVFDWAREERKHIGTVAHALFERFGREGIEGWNRERLGKLTPGLKARLAALGVASERLDHAAGEVVRAAGAILDDPRARALFVTGEGAASEYAVTSVKDGVLSTRRIDRTFLDAEGTRWIVDFKLAAHEGGDLEGFLAAERERHREQLADYARLMGLMEPGRKVRAALYYPLLGSFVELDA